MSYVINQTNGSVLTTVLDGTVDNTTGLTLIGRNYINYGTAQNDNFVRLVENFANNTPPTQITGATKVLTGTLWYDTANNLLKVYDGLNFNPVSQRMVSSTQPTAKNIGDQWWNSTDQQLFSWTGANWLLTGPAYTASQGKSGVFVEQIADTNNNSHTVVNKYTNGNLVSTESYDSFQPTGLNYNGFTQISNGLSVGNNVIVGQSLTVNNQTNLSSVAINGNLYVATPAGSGTLINLAATNSYDLGTATDVFRDLYLGRNLAFTGANISYSNYSLAMQNFSLLGNIDLYINSGSFGNISALHISGLTGRVTVIGDPLQYNDVANKNYVDNNIITLTNYVNSQDSNLQALIASVSNSQTANLNLAVNSVDTNVNSLSSSVDSRFQLANLSISNLQANAISQENEIINLNTYVNNVANSVSYANIYQTNNINTQIAIINSNINLVNNNLTNSINSLAATTATNLSNAVAPLAPLASPAFTGVPSAPTPSPTDTSTKIATTAFVAGAIGTTISNIFPPSSFANTPAFTVSASAPSGGKSGDIWFQIG